MKFDLANRFDRIVRLTVNSSHMADAMLSAKGDKLYYLSVFEDGYDLWEHNLKENVTKVLLKKVGAGALQPDKEGKNIFLCARDGMKKIEIEGSKISPIEFEAFFDYRPYGEREYIFDHIWQQVMISSMWQTCKVRTGMDTKKLISASCLISTITTILWKC